MAVNIETVPIAESSHGDASGYLFSFGAYASTHVAVLGSAVEDCLEAAIEWLDENAPGLLSTVGEDDYKRAAADLHVEWPPDEGTDERDVERVRNQAEADMTMVTWTTLKNGNAVASWEWSFRALSATELEIIRRRSNDE